MALVHRTIFDGAMRISVIEHSPVALSMEIVFYSICLSGGGVIFESSTRFKTREDAGDAAKRFIEEIQRPVAAGDDDGPIECDPHRRVYSSYIIDTAPSKQSWICEACGATGMETLGHALGLNMSRTSDEERYQELRAQADRLTESSTS